MEKPMSKDFWWHGRLTESGSLRTSSSREEPGGVGSGPDFWASLLTGCARKGLNQCSWKSENRIGQHVRCTKGGHSSRAVAAKDTMPIRQKMRWLTGFPLFSLHQDLCNMKGINTGNK